MRTLTPTERRAFRAKAHHLHPFVSIGRHGLTPAVLHEIDVNLLAHELIKIRVFSDDRSEREALLARICADLDAAPVQHLGKILTIWRPAPEPEAPITQPRGKSVGVSSKQRQAQPREKPAGGASKRRRGQPDEEPAGGASKRRRVQPRSAEPRQHYYAAPAGPRGNAPSDSPSGTRSRRRKAGPRGDAVARVVHEPRTRRRTSR